MVKECIKELISAESGSKTAFRSENHDLLLRKEGICVARRTIANIAMKCIFPRNGTKGCIKTTGKIRGRQNGWFS
jgi:hypothetical protein